MTKRGQRGFTLIELLVLLRKLTLSGVRNLSQLQEVYHNSYYTYAGTLTAAEAVPSEGVTVTINEATGTGWAATATHLGVSSEQCGIYHGNAAASGGSPAVAVGVVTCTY